MSEGERERESVGEGSIFVALTIKLMRTSHIASHFLKSLEKFYKWPFALPMGVPQPTNHGKCWHSFSETILLLFLSNFL